jgi:hypothetical protein
VSKKNKRRKRRKKSKTDLDDGFVFGDCFHEWSVEHLFCLKLKSELISFVVVVLECVGFAFFGLFLTFIITWRFFMYTFSVS